MTLFKRRSNTARLLEEYPWLWAVNSSWSPHHQIWVETLSGYTLSQECVEGTRWWVYTGKSGEWEQVYPVGCNPRVNVATAACSAINCGDRIMHLVSRAGEQPFILYRAPKDTDMHVMCVNRYSTPELQKPADVVQIVEVSRKQHLGWIQHLWPDKAKVVDSLTRSAELTARGWPPYPVGAVRNLWIDFGRRIELAQKPDECVEALFTVLKYLACPEPGWDGVELKIVD